MLGNYELLIRRYQVVLMAPLVKNGPNHAGDLAANWPALLQEEPEFIRVVNELASKGDQRLGDAASEFLKTIQQFPCKLVLQRFFEIAEILNALKKVTQKPAEVFCGLLVQEDDEDVTARRVHMFYKTIVAIWDWQLKDEAGFAAMPVDVKERWDELRVSIEEVDAELPQRITAIL
jgi:hypothetical protein